MTKRPPGLDKLLNYVTDRIDEPVRCGSCGGRFDPSDARHDGVDRYQRTPWCNRCVTRCHESADTYHSCTVCREQ